MKITKSQLKQIIKEEFGKIPDDRSPRNPKYLELIRLVTDLSRNLGQAFVRLAAYKAIGKESIDELIIRAEKAIQKYEDSDF